MLFLPIKLFIISSSYSFILCSLQFLFMNCRLIIFCYFLLIFWNNSTFLFALLHFRLSICLFQSFILFNWISLYFWFLFSGPFPFLKLFKDLLNNSLIIIQFYYLTNLIRLPHSGKGPNIILDVFIVGVFPHIFTMLFFSNMKLIIFNLNVTNVTEILFNLRVFQQFFLLF